MLLTVTQSTIAIIYQNVCFVNSFFQFFLKFEKYKKYEILTKTFFESYIITDKIKPYTLSVYS